MIGVIFLHLVPHFILYYPTLDCAVKLDNTIIGNTKPEAKPYKMADGGGMYLEVMPNGSKYWRLHYRLGGKQQTLALGVYPKVSLEAARAGHDDARHLLATGGDPMAAICEAAQQKKERANALPSFRLSMTGDVLTIQSKGETLALTAEQTAAVRAITTPCGKP